MLFSSVPSPQLDCCVVCIAQYLTPCKKEKKITSLTALSSCGTPATSTMQSERTDLEQSLLSELECPVCLEYMMPPITFCVNGHNICNICKPKVAHCPSCRQYFLNTRNVALEKLARQVNYSCKYRMYGCKEIFPHNMIGEHHDSCRYSPQVCPVAKVANAICSWTGSYNDIKEHLKEKHLAYCYNYVEGYWEWLAGFTSSASYWRFVFVNNEVFFRQFLEKEGIFFAAVLYVGPPENAANYKYKFKFVNKDNTEGVTIMHVTRSFTENMDDIFRSGNCGKLHSDVVSRLRYEKGSLKYKMTIRKIGD